jgi:glycosyltransferase involved in cell wall biosynthesis
MQLPMRILFAVTVPVTARTVLRGQLSFLHELGWDVHVVCAPGDPFADKEDRRAAVRHELPFSRSLLSPGGDLRAYLGFVRLLRETRPDVVVLGSPKASLLGVLAAASTRTPSLYVLHGLRLEGARGLPRLAMTLLERLTARLANRVLVVGHDLRRTMLRLRIADPAKVAVLGSGSANGVDLDHFVPQSPADRAAAKASLGLPDAYVVGFVGRLAADKGLDLLADAWSRVRAQLPTARLLVVGGNDLPDRRTTELVESLRALPGATLVGEVADTRRYYAAMDLLALPSRREGLPTVVLEAAACGLPSVVTDATGTREAVLHERTGIVTRMDDPADLADALVRLADADARSRLGARARSRVVEEFERRDVWRRQARFYEDVARAGSREQPATAAGTRSVEMEGG